MSDHRPQLTLSRTRSAVVATAALSVVLVAGCGKAPEVDHELTASLIQPVARVEIKVAREEPGRRTGEQIYSNVCTGCHAAGALGAPKTGDAGDWEARLAKGLEALVASVTNGMGAMPPKGGGADLTDTEIVRATAYLANTAGGSFEEPPVE